ncbi:MAG TPA: pilus assembly PilX N-terminal domain-containing protein [Longimicrobium sp.]|uniref:pilus assembly PilX family protein n=1 Tax=Longimicrobium sp. TaxID=2029185 RepID=UPI002ED7B153
MTSRLVPGRARDRRGAALPVALMGLVAITLLVTAALFTSSTEYAISRAHRFAASSLFNADGALEQYVAQRVATNEKGWLIQADADAVAGPDGQNYTVQVDKLSDTRDTLSVPMRRDEVFSLLVQPANGRGRGVGAFIRTLRTANRLNTNINAGATSGGDLRVSGNATISDGRSGTNYCGAANNRSDYAVQVTAGAEITLGNNATRNLEGAADTASFTKAFLEHNVLGTGMTVRQLAEAAEIQFGRTYGEDEFSTQPINADTDTDSRYNWGCPASLGVTCPSPASAERHVVVAIDANGGTVRLNGRYGQGMLIVINGSLEIQGNFTYKGIILVERDLSIRGGTPGNESKIEGGVISFGASSTVEDNISGTATIKYNICAINDAESALNRSALDNAAQKRNGSNSWYELIR